MAEQDDEPVGYGRPPRHSRFKKGRSGNPSGRPKGSQNINTLMKARFAQTMRVREGGKVRTLTVAELIVLSVTTKAAQGHTPSQAIVFGLWEKAGGFGRPDPEPEQPLPDEDEALLRAHLARRGGGSGA